jgi:hypothetical protein
VCLGDGLGGFSCSNLTDESEEAFDGPTTTKIQVADFDEDGVPDLVLAAYSGAGWRNEVCLGAGDGTFSCLPVADEAARTSDAGIADFDGDGHTDVVFANSGTPERVCLGDGAGAFACSDMAGPTTHEYAKVGDFNADGMPDVVLAGGSSPDHLLCLGDGSGAFDCAIRMPSDNGMGSAEVVVHDFSYDGNDDLLFSYGGHLVVCILDRGATEITCEKIEVAPVDERGFRRELFAGEIVVLGGGPGR